MSMCTGPRRSPSASTAWAVQPHTAASATSPASTARPAGVPAARPASVLVRMTAPSSPHRGGRTAPVSSESVPRA
ncbi:hypothetical protein SGLAM104S_07519 [Streptomyces glaucescens]